MAKRKTEVTIKLKRDYVEGDDYEPEIQDELKRLVGQDDLQPFKAGSKAKIKTKKRRVAVTLTIHEDGPDFFMTAVNAVSIASGIATLVSLWLQLRTPAAPPQQPPQDHYVVITIGKNTFKGKPGKKRLKELVKLMTAMVK